MPTDFKVREKQFIAATVVKGGGIHAYLRDADGETRYIYYVDAIRTGAMSKSTMLLGHFIDEFEDAPDAALKLTPGWTNRLYFPNSENVVSYDYLTEEEVLKTKGRLEELGRNHPEYNDTIGNLLEALASHNGVPAGA